MFSKFSQKTVLDVLDLLDLLDEICKSLTMNRGKKTFLNYPKFSLLSLARNWGMLYFCTRVLNP